jgi:hypothetical protein
MPQSIPLAADKVYKHEWKDWGDWRREVQFKGEYRSFEKARKTWPILPYEEIVKRIKQLSPRLMI